VPSLVDVVQDVSTTIIGISTTKVEVGKA